MKHKTESPRIDELRREYARTEFRRDVRGVSRALSRCRLKDHPSGPEAGGISRPTTDKR